MILFKALLDDDGVKLVEMGGGSASFEEAEDRRRPRARLNQLNCHTPSAKKKKIAIHRSSLKKSVFFVGCHIISTFENQHFHML